MDEIRIKLHILLFVIFSMGILNGCVSSGVVMGKMPQTPGEYVVSAEESIQHKTRLVNIEFTKLVEKLKRISKQCYQFEVKASINGGERYRDVYTSKVTMLSTRRVAFTMQQERISGREILYAHNDKPDGGMWDYVIVVDKTSDEISTAKLYFRLFFYEDDMNAVLDTVEGKYGEGCPPEELLY